MTSSGKDSIMMVTSFDRFPNLNWWNRNHAGRGSIEAGANISEGRRFLLNGLRYDYLSTICKGSPSSTDPAGCL
jgi:hypothetical protein